MRIFRHVEEVPADFGPTIVSVGNFDGIHCAHQAVIREIVRRARETRSKSMVVTFEPHPVRILRPDVPHQLITTLPLKLRLLEQTGVDAVALITFTRDLSLLPPREFAEQILARGLHVSEVYEGFNFRFGHKATGDVNTLTELGREFGFEVKVYPPTRIRGDVVSSTRIRELIAEGNVTRARMLLGRPFSILSAPGRGRGYGHKYTVPTINLSHYDELVPKDGVYITHIRIDRETFDSVTNVGNRPTFGADSFAIESHLLNFHPITLNADTEIELHFLRRIRAEQKFPSVEALRSQIAKDVHRARRYFHLRQLLVRQLSRPSRTRA